MTDSPYRVTFDDNTALVFKAILDFKIANELATYESIVQKTKISVEHVRKIINQIQKDDRQLLRVANFNSHKGGPPVKAFDVDLTNIISNHLTAYIITEIAERGIESKGEVRFEELKNDIVKKLLALKYKESNLEELKEVVEGKFRFLMGRYITAGTDDTNEIWLDNIVFNQEKKLISLLADEFLSGLRKQK